MCRLPSMSRSIHRQLHAALKGKGWSLRELHRRSGLSCSEVSLSRKLRGLQKLFADEVEVLAVVLEAEISTGPVQPQGEAA